MVGLASPAGAGPTVLTGNQNSLGQAGSDTIIWMMNLITPAYNVNIDQEHRGCYLTRSHP